MKRMLKQLASHFPRRTQQELKRRLFGWQIRHHGFRTREPEYDLLDGMVAAGDWAVDIGANIGHYSLRLSELVGGQGRVIAFEPVPETFELLAANARVGGRWNLTLINAAASDSFRTSGMSITQFEDTGLDDMYTAELVSGAASARQVFCMTVDALCLPHAVSLVKIDAEGHELPALRGMIRLLERDHPVLIVENNDPDIPDFLAGLGYECKKNPGSPNCVYRAGDQRAGV